MDLALAKFVEAKLPQAGRLDAAQYGLLTQACRQAKEALLGPEPAGAADRSPSIGRGRAVIGGTLHAPLTPAEVRAGHLRRLLPAVPPRRRCRSAAPRRPARDGPALRQRPGRHAAPGRVPAPPRAATATGPDAILFNGGVFQPQSLRDRLLEVMRGWYGRRRWQPLVLTNPSLDLAVALGAAYYAWLRHTGGKRIGGGIAALVLRRRRRRRRRRATERSTVLCVVPQHLEEGQEIDAAEAGAGTGAGPAGRRSRCTPRRCAATTSPATCCASPRDQLLHAAAAARRSCAAASGPAPSTCR